MSVNGTVRNKKNERAFLEALADTCNVRLACALSNVSRSTVYLWRQEDPAFKQRWEEAAKIGAAALEEEAIRRAHEGWLEPVYYKGEIRGEVRKYSDTLLIFLLKGAKPEKYREKVQNEHTGPNGGPIQTSIAVRFVDAE